jgi:hypothetical protein
MLLCKLPGLVLIVVAKDCMAVSLLDALSAVNQPVYGFKELALVQTTI